MNAKDTDSGCYAPAAPPATVREADQATMNAMGGITEHVTSSDQRNDVSTVPAPPASLASGLLPMMYYWVLSRS